MLLPGTGSGPKLERPESQLAQTLRLAPAAVPRYSQQAQGRADQSPAGAFGGGFDVTRDHKDMRRSKSSYGEAGNNEIVPAFVGFVPCHRMQHGTEAQHSVTAGRVKRE